MIRETDRLGLYAVGMLFLLALAMVATALFTPVRPRRAPQSEIAARALTSNFAERSSRAREAIRSLGARRADEPLFGVHDYRTVFRKACIKALGTERGELPTPYDLKHARVTHLLDAGAPVTGIRFLTGTNVALDHYVQSTRRAAEQAIGGHSGDEATTEECEGEDLNLHGSYPASTSIEFDNVYIRGKRGKTGTDDDGEPPSKNAAFRTSVRLSGDGPPMPGSGIETADSEADAFREAMGDAAERGLRGFRPPAKTRPYLARKRASQRGEADLAIIFILVAAAIFVVIAALMNGVHGDECRARGGFWYCAYKSPCLCLAKGTVLP
jgi:hypothetical protein